jgi:hypothetical protein
VCQATIGEVLKVHHHRAAATPADGGGGL